MSTQKDIARELGVSVSVVSRALNPRPDKNARIAPEMRRQILEAADRLNYRPNQLARSLRRGRPLVAGALLPTLRDRLTGEIVQGIAEVATAADLPVMFYFGHHDQALRDFWRKAMNYEHSGLIVPPGNRISLSSLETYLEQGGRIVLLDPSYRLNEELSGLTAIGIDDCFGGELAARRLLGRGCTRFFHCGSTYKRIEGFRAWLLAEKAAVEPVDEDGAVPIIRNCRPTAAAPVGVFAENDSHAVAICTRLAAAGLTPGREVLVIGYNDLELTGLLPWPLTTVRQPFRQLGADLMTALIDLLSDRPARPFLLKPELIVRSTA